MRVEENDRLPGDHAAESKVIPAIAMMPRIDAHQHFWTLKRDDYAWLTPGLAPLYRDFQPADLEPLLAERNIASTILVQAAPTIAETRYLLQLAARHDFIAGVVGWVDMTSDSCVADLSDLALDPRLVGIRPMLQDIADPAWITRPDLARATQALIDRGLCFDALVRSVHLPHLLEFLRRYPELKAVIDHGAKPNIAQSEWQPWADAISDIAQTTGVYCKLSGLLTEMRPTQGYDELSPYMDHLLASFGPDRLMWGSDWPVLNLVGNYGDWLSMAERFLQGMGDEEQGKVLGGNAAAFYGAGGS